MFSSPTLTLFFSFFFKRLRGCPFLDRAGFLFGWSRCFRAGLAAELPTLSHRAVLEHRGGYHNTEAGCRKARSQCETCFTVSRTQSGLVLAFSCWLISVTEDQFRLLLLTIYDSPNQICCNVFPRKHGVLPVVEIDYHQGLNNQTSILETIRVAILSRQLWRMR